MKPRIIIVLLILVAAGFTVFERYVLVGTVLVNATATISDINPTVTVPIEVPNDGDEITVFMKAADVPVSYSIVAPSEEVIVEHAVSLGRHDFSFDAPRRGIYFLLLENDADEGSVIISVWANDSRLFYGLYF